MNTAKLNAALRVIWLLAPAGLFAQGTLISSFGSNPGNLRAFKYIPADMPPNAPLVVVMHGCTQDAAEYAGSSGWNDLAEKHKFYVVYAEQKAANNASNCFNYWEPADHSREAGEAKSIKQMVDYMKSNYNIDSTRVFATGLSAGGAMTIVMLSTYPEVFAAGAEMAGLPYKAATSMTEVYLAAIGGVSKSPQQWGDLVRAQYSNYTGKYPRLSIFHGTSDIVINDQNAEEAIKQFTHLHGTDQTADYYDPAFNGHSNIKYRQYFDAGSNVVVEYYALEGMAHGIAVDPGNCYEQGGSTVGVAFDVDFHSSFYAAKFFGILRQPFSISGTSEVGVNEQNVLFSVPAITGAHYEWEVPAGATIVSGQGNASVTVNWGSSSGWVRVTETLPNGCVNPTVELFVTAAELPLGVAANGHASERLIIEQTNNGIEYSIKGGTGYPFAVNLSDMSGKIIFTENGINANQHRLITQKLSPGIYILNCIAPQKRLQEKVIIYQ